MTEAGPRVTAQWVGSGVNKLGSVGKPIGGVSLIIKDPEGNNCQSEAIGKIYVKSPSLMLGYLNDPESTHEKIVDDWLDTGDLGYMDEPGGCLFLAGLMTLLFELHIKLIPTGLKVLFIRFKRWLTVSFLEYRTRLMEPDCMFNSAGKGSHSRTQKGYASLSKIFAIV